ncbi:MAG: TlpA disulfide reductase family protein [Acidimicrobiales bacterium]|nr:TlpA disulfide reductase family protein [Acidimicrobiales bacterium]
MMDRLQRFSPVLAAGLLLGTAVVGHTAPPSPEDALVLKPVQPGVDYEKVEADQQSGCKVIDIDESAWSGWEVIAEDGTLLRRFADTNRDQKIDLWCYFKFGVEVYRDVDQDFNGKADQYRWLATGGTRWGLDRDEDGGIDSWKQISAEEVTAEVVAALREKDTDRFAPLVIVEQELDFLGLGKEKKTQILALSIAAKSGFGELAKDQDVVADDAVWVQFAAGTPGVVPSGTEGSTRDVVVYENAVAMFDQGNGSGQLMVGTLVQVGKAWRLVGLPVLGEEGSALAQAGGNFFAPDTATASSVMNDSGAAQKTQDLVTALEKIDTQFAVAKDSAAIAILHERRAGVVEKLVLAAATKEDREIWFRQLVDMLSMGAQTGSYPSGLERLRTVSQRFAGDDESLKAYADYQSIGADYMVRQTPNADFAEVQEWYIGVLSRFVERYPATPEAAQAWLNLALSKEFEDKDKEALAYYKKVVSLFSKTSSGEIAAGAVRRLESVGREVDLEGTTLDGKPFRLSRLRGKPVVLHYWATWCEPCKQDMKLLRRLQASYQRAGLQVVGVNVDLTKQEAQRYLQQTQVSWTQLFEPGGLDGSRLAKAFGVQTLPTMMLIDPQGKVVRHNVRAAELQTEIDRILQDSK